jgi:hypothetical protein
VCGGGSRSLLDLPAQPIYQHPVPADVEVPPPHTIDLSWVACEQCCHAWQPSFDNALLERIYRSHYYTPAPDGIAVQFRNHFLAAVDRIGLITPRRVLLEIGASDGAMLADLRSRTGATRAYAFEPNGENAAVARKRGLEVREEFFGKRTNLESLDRAELIYSRHVIEHVFEFGDFFVGLNDAATSTADLVLETPSLDYHVERASSTPFHVEHIHVFALRSLATLAARHTWGLQHALVTAAGNLIASFKRGEAMSGAPATSLQGFQAAITRQRAHLRSLFAGRRLIFWGAGSAGVCLANTIGREPDIWTDGNPNKIGKKIVGLTRRIVSPEQAFADARMPEFSTSVLVVASSFVEEILPRIRQLGWAGEVFDLAGNRRQA